MVCPSRRQIGLLVLTAGATQGFLQMDVHRPQHLPSSKAPRATSAIRKLRSTVVEAPDLPTQVSAPSKQTESKDTGKNQFNWSKQV